jgi:hypothetical protein
LKSHLNERQQARSFGRSVGLVLLFIGAYQLWRGRVPLGAGMLMVGAVLLTLGTVAPMAINVPSRLWWRFSAALGWVNSRILLSLFFFLVLTPIGLIFRLAGRDTLAQRKRDSTWSPYPARPRDHFERLF